MGKDPDDKKHVLPTSKHHEKKVQRLNKAYQVTGKTPRAYKQTGKGIVPRSAGGFWRRLFGDDDK